MGPVGGLGTISAYIMPSHVHSRYTGRGLRKIEDTSYLELVLFNDGRFHAFEHDSYLDGEILSDESLWLGSWTKSKEGDASAVDLKIEVVATVDDPSWYAVYH